MEQTRFLYSQPLLLAGDNHDDDDCWLVQHGFIHHVARYGLGKGSEFGWLLGWPTNVRVLGGGGNERGHDDKGAQLQICRCVCVCWLPKLISSHFFFPKTASSFPVWRRTNILARSPLNEEDDDNIYCSHYHRGARQSSAYNTTSTHTQTSVRPTPIDLRFAALHLQHTHTTPRYTVIPA